MTNPTYIERKYVAHSPFQRAVAEFDDKRILEVIPFLDYGMPDNLRSAGLYEKNQLLAGIVGKTILNTPIESQGFWTRNLGQEDFLRYLELAWIPSLPEGSESGTDYGLITRHLGKWILMFKSGNVNVLNEKPLELSDRLQ